MRRLVAAWWVFVMACVVYRVVWVFAAAGPLTLRVTPVVGFAPLAVTLDIHVIPDPGDRTIWITSGPDIGRSDIPLAGASSQRTHHRVWNISEPGEYTIRAEVGNALERRAAATSHILIR